MAVVHLGNIASCQPRGFGAESNSAMMTEAKTDLPAKLISELVTDPDFPHSAVGAMVDIKGYTGVIVEVVRNSIKVRSPRIS